MSRIILIIDFSELKRIMNNQKESLAFYIYDILRNDPNIIRCSFAGFGWSEAKIMELCEALQKNDYITEIDLSSNKVGKYASIALAELPNLKKLNLSENALRNASALALSQSKSLEWLNLQNNSITDTGMNYLSENSHCLTILLDYNIFASPESIVRVEAACSYNQLIKDQKSLVTLESSANPKSSKERAEYIEKYFKNNYINPDASIPNLGKVTNVSFVWDPEDREVIHSVDITSIDISPYINEIIRNDPSITKISFTNFNLRNENVIKICEALCKNKYITEVDLEGNLIDDKGAEALANLKMLKKLSLRSNYLSDKGLYALSLNKNLEWLNIENNDITQTGINYLIENTRCHYCFVENNFSGNEELYADLAAACDYNRFIRDQKLLFPDDRSIINNSEDRRKYVDQHWREFYQEQYCHRQTW